MTNDVPDTLQVPNLSNLSVQPNRSNEWKKKEEKNHFWLFINILVRPELVTQKKLYENEVQPRKYKQEKKSKQLESACRLI